jgi:hypothetical protein
MIRYENDYINYSVIIPNYHHFPELVHFSLKYFIELRVEVFSACTSDKSSLLTFLS